MEPLRVGVIGCGHLGTYHARAYARHPECRLAGVADIVAEKASTLAQASGCPGFFSHEHLIGRVDAVSVATPTTTHEPIAADFLRAGVHVLVEKPLAPDVAAGDRLVAAARSAGRVLAVGHIERCNPAFARARQALSAPRFMEAHRLATFVPRSLDVDVVLDLMIHDLDLVLSLARSPVESVDAIGVPVITQEADIASARIRFGDGSVANLTASRVSRARMRKIRFFEKCLYLSVDLAEKRLEMIRLVPAGGQLDLPDSAPAEARMLAAKGFVLRPEHVQAEGDALDEEIARFVGACAGKGAPAVNGEEGLACLALAVQVRAGVSASLRRLEPDGPVGGAGGA